MRKNKKLGEPDSWFKASIFVGVWLLARCIVLARTFDSREFSVAFFLFPDSRSSRVVNPMRVCPDFFVSFLVASFFFLKRREAGKRRQNE